MTRRQICPAQWFIVDQRRDQETWRVLQALPRGSGVLLLRMPGAADHRRLRRIAKSRSLTLVVERREAASRVHGQHELTRALLRRSKLILLSPIHRTSSHPDWQPLPRMRAATLARLAKRNVVALGGMNRRNYAKVAQLGFIGWAGISAFKT